MAAPSGVKAATGDNHLSSIGMIILRGLFL